MHTVRWHGDKLRAVLEPSIGYNGQQDDVWVVVGIVVIVIIVIVVVVIEIDMYVWQCSIWMFYYVCVYSGTSI